MPDFVTVQVNGRAVKVASGTTVAAALLGEGEAEFRTSVTGEPRAALCGMGICFECRVSIDGCPQSRSCQTLVRDGMVVDSRGRSGIGLQVGNLPHKGLSPDVLIIGAGPAGMTAALRAQECGARVTVLDDNPAPGGQIWRGGNARTSRWFARFNEAKIPVIPGACVVSWDRNSNTLLVETQKETLELSYRALILATGAREIFLPFPGWTLPGIMGVGGIQALVKSGMPVAGKRVVIAGSGPLLLAAAAYLRKRGALVKLIAEQAGRDALVRFGFGLLATSPGKMAQAVSLRLSLAGVPYLPGCWVTAAEGDGRLERVRLRRGTKTWTEDCDYAGIAYGLAPNTELAALLGCRVEAEGVTVDEFQHSSIPGVFCAGECTGIGGLDLALVEGQIAGYAACDRKPSAEGLFGKRSRARRFAASLNSAFALRDELKSLPQSDTFVCRCEDVTFARLSGMPSFRAAKLHTRCGMGPCQARVCGPAMEFLFGWRTESIRPPIFPARLGSLAFEKELISK